MSRTIEENEVSSLVACFSRVSDPRVQGRCVHRLIDVLVIAICAVLCGARSCTDFEDFAEAKACWLKRFLELPGGLPSHDTFRRVLSLIDPVQMEACFSEWVKAVLGERRSKAVSIDGKSVGGSPQGGARGRRCLHLVNVYSHDYGLSLGQSEADGIGKENTAALEALDLLDIRDTLVMMDAGFAVHRVAAKIRAQKGHYLMALKNNQRFYRDRVNEKFSQGGKAIAMARTQEKAHGREEIRSARVIAVGKGNLDPKFLEQWPGLKTLIQVERTRRVEDLRPFLRVKNEQTGEMESVRNANLDEKSKLMRTSQETLYYLTSKPMTAAVALREVRKHWGIENRLHWVLDVAFAEDDWLVRARRLSRNLSAVRKIGLNLIRARRPQTSIRRQMKMAGWADEALEKLVFGKPVFDA